MKIEKQWYSIKEISKKLECSIADLLYLGTTGELELGFDWLNFAIEDEAQNHILDFSFTEPYNKIEERYTHKSLPIPDYKGDPINRIATLSTDCIGLLQKNNVALVSSAHVGNTMLVIQSTGRPDLTPCIHIEVKDIVITTQTLNNYQKRKSKISQKPTDNQASTLFANVTHYSEMLVATKSAVEEFWEGKPNLEEANKRATNEAVAAWIRANFPFIDITTAKYIARIIRPEKFKRRN